MTQVRARVRSGAYYDSLVLMQLQQAMDRLPGVLEAGVVMGTAANRDMLARSGLLVASAENACATDLVIAVRAEGVDEAEAALERVDELLVRHREAGEEEYVPKSLRTASRLLPRANWVVVSVPGRYAADVTWQALELGTHVFLFSDHVPLAEEAELKREAAERGLLVLGPECGSAIIGGIGFGFANRVRRGPVGLVCASGTGLQQVSCVVGQSSGISHALGVGGRDLAEEVGGQATLQALDLLGRDPETRVVVLVTKPPSGRVASRVLEAARGAGKPVVILFLGHAIEARRAGNLTFASSLEDAARLAVGPTEGEGVLKADHGQSGAGRPPFTDGQRYVRGLYSGGTLAFEARLLLQAHGLAVSANALVQPGNALRPAGPVQGAGHRILDLGAEEFTQGRPHPMISQDTRLRLLREEASDPEVAVILLDVILGDGAHPNPAAELAPACARAIAEALGAGRRLEVIAVLVGTDEDPQGLESQAQQLRAAGVQVARGNEAVVEQAASLVHALEASQSSSRRSPVSLKVLEPPVAALNVGLEWFADSLAAQGVEALHVDWRPPAGGDDRLRAILDRLKG